MTAIWKTGVPPSIGWWPASVSKDAGVLRWWNGKEWSGAARQGFSPKQIASVLCWKYPAADTINPIYWTARPATWPEASFT